MERVILASAELEYATVGQAHRVILSRTSGHCHGLAAPDRATRPIHTCKTDAGVTGARLIMTLYMPQSLDRRRVDHTALDHTALPT